MKAIILIAWQCIVFGTTLTVALLTQSEAAQQLIPGFMAAENLGANAPIYYWTGPGTQALAPVEGTYVQVLGRPAGSMDDLKLLPDTYGKTTFGLIAPGYFGELLVIDFVTGPIGSHLPMEFIIRSWRGADSWETAQITSGALVGQTPIFQDDAIANFIFETGPLIPGSFLHATSFTLIPIPEPSVMRLSIAGLLVFIIRRVLRDEKPSA